MGRLVENNTIWSLPRSKNHRLRFLPEGDKSNISFADSTCFDHILSTSQRVFTISNQKLRGHSGLQLVGTLRDLSSVLPNVLVTLWELSFPSSSASSSSSTSSSSSSSQLKRKRNLFQLLHVSRQNQVAGSLLFPSLHFYFHHLQCKFCTSSSWITIRSQHRKTSAKFYFARFLLSSWSKSPGKKNSFPSFSMLKSKTWMPECSFSIVALLFGLFALPAQEWWEHNLAKPR